MNNKDAGVNPRRKKSNKKALGLQDKQKLLVAAVAKAKEMDESERSRRAKSEESAAGSFLNHFQTSPGPQGLGGGKAAGGGGGNRGQSARVPMVGARGMMSARGPPRNRDFGALNEHSGQEALTQSTVPWHNFSLQDAPAGYVNETRAGLSRSPPMRRGTREGCALFLARAGQKQRGGGGGGGQPFP